jgi:hypothetical protein
MVCIADECAPAVGFCFRRLRGQGVSRHVVLRWGPAQRQ